MTIGATPGGELSLRQMLDDPIVHVVMARDGVSRSQVEDLVAALRACRRGAGDDARPGDRTGAPERATSAAQCPSRRRRLVREAVQ